MPFWGKNKLVLEKEKAASTEYKPWKTLSSNLSNGKRHSSLNSLISRRLLTVSIESHFGKLQDLIECPEKIVSMIKCFYTQFECSVLLNNKETDWFVVNSGVRQGCITSPIVNCYWLGNEEDYEGLKKGNFMAPIWTFTLLMISLFCHHDKTTYKKSRRDSVTMQVNLEFILTPQNQKKWGSIQRL